MRLYAGIDLHANNSYLAVIDEADELVLGKRCLFRRKRSVVPIQSGQQSERSDAVVSSD